MSTMNVSLPDELKQFVDEQVEEGGFGSTSEFVRALIRREQDRQQLRALLAEGATSPVAGPADDAYFAALRARVEQPAG
jgi:antitoxin ParD1/3/4